MPVKQDVLKLTAETGSLSLASAFDALDEPVPAVFLACRELYAMGELTRVGPGEYELSDQGWDRLNRSRRDRTPVTRISKTEEAVGQHADTATPDAEIDAAESSADQASGNTFDWNDFENSGVSSGNPTEPDDELRQDGTVGEVADDHESDPTSPNDGFAWITPESAEEDTNVE